MNLPVVLYLPKYIEEIMRIGVIDIGYNAIRAVVYDNDKICAREIFNNKFKNDLLSLLASPELEIKHQTYLSISYILSVFKNLGVESTRCVATAVLRNHKRSTEFCQYINENFDIDIEIITGEQEAYLTARGLLCGIPEANGIVADLGGGSLELAVVSNRQIESTSSLELGTKVIANKQLGNEDKLTDLIAECYGEEHFENLYMIGGALRFICRFYIELYKYPLKNLHNLAIPREEFLNFLDDLSTPRFTKTKNGKRRINHNAILVARALINVFQPNCIIVSTHGLKEGVRYEMLSTEEKNKDILLMKLKRTFRSQIEIEDTKQYTELLRPILGYEVDRHERLLQYAQIIVPSKFGYDQTIPPKAVIENILTSEIQFTHIERIKLALIIFYTTNFKIDPQLLKISKYLLSKDESIYCQILGHFIKICIDVDGPEFHSPSFVIIENDTYLEIETKSMLPRPIFDKVCERLKLIAFCLRNLNANLG